MDYNHSQFLDGLNMENDYFDLSGPSEMGAGGSEAGPSGSGATPTSRPPKSKKHTSNVWQCFDVVQKTMPDGQLMDRAQCKFCTRHYVTSRGDRSFTKAYGEMHACTRTGRHYNPNTTTTAPRRVRYNMAL